MWFRNFVPFTLVAAALCVPALLWIMKADPSEANTADDLVDMYFTWPLYTTLALSTLLVPLLMYRLIRQLEGSWTPLATSMQVGLRGFLPALILAVVMNVLQRIPVAGIAAAIIRCMWFVAAPSAIAETLGPLTALGRSTELTHGRRWNIFGLAFLIGVALVACFFIGPYSAMDSLRDGIVSFERPAIFCAIASGVLFTFSGLAEAVGYVLLRREKEGIPGAINPEQIATAIALPPRRPDERGPGDAST
jgi:hypothetical protein